MLVIILLTAILLGFGMYEFAMHRRRVLAIPIRIHVNGTRGKSSVTRLIASGLRAGGIRTLAKVTGTLPRIIDEKGMEVPITRIHMVNIIEQIKVFRYFAKKHPQAIVMECMAVQPEYQWICEHQFVRATVGVITNARMDHVREMGPHLDNIAMSLSNTIPSNAKVFSAENRPRLMHFMYERAEESGSDFVVTVPSEINDDCMRRFSYIEHPSNVSLALRVCEEFGIDRETALDGMVKAYPDPGALYVHRVTLGNKQVMFLNALAANDPESTFMAWQRARELYPLSGKRILLLNTRGDRFDRSVQLVEMIGLHMKDDFDLLFSMGESTEMLTAHIRRSGIDPQKVVRLGQVKPEKAWDAIWESVEERAFVFALGNAGHGGLAVTHLFRSRRS
ncbi:MAG: poly-gamma-glutamate synthase PgsB [Candidatus Electryonea clarkiae]|nr:poly-gamma-glutamate synthase PgsB [Candidatus Electryonea clarkiae]MDP8288005.1 poly-gamma-glutamate synthase PgsB [Candidatus Electryonea clarkiae]